MPGVDYLIYLCTRCASLKTRKLKMKRIVRMAVSMGNA